MEILPTRILPSLSPPQFELADLDGDNRQDMVMVYTGDDGNTSMRVGKGLNVNGGFQSGWSNPVSLPVAPKHQFKLADLNGDGRRDMVMTYTGDDGNTSMWVGNGLLGNGTFVNGITWAPAHLPVAPRHQFQLADLDGDGRQDMVMTYTGDDGNTSMWVGNGLLGNGTFINGITWAPAHLPVSPAHQFALADLDGDGRTDMSVIYTGDDNYTSGRVGNGLNVNAGFRLGFSEPFEILDRRRTVARDLRGQWGPLLDETLRNATPSGLSWLGIRRAITTEQFDYDGTTDQVHFRASINYRQRLFGETIWSITATVEGWVNLKNPSPFTFRVGRVTVTGVPGWDEWAIKLAVVSFFERNADGIRHS